MNALTRFFQKPIFSDKRFIFSVWLLVALAAGLKHAFRSLNNNYLIFKHVFYNTIDQVNLYAPYEDKYFDTNHYGPIFSLVIAPFALLPDGLGTILWEVFIAATLLFAIYKLPFTWKAKTIIYWITVHEIYLNAVNSQTNTLIAAIVIGSFVLIRGEKDFWAACLITLGLFIKLYGVVGLAFFFFSKHKPKLVAYLLLWSIVFFVLPMLISSPQFIIQSYYDWYESLSVKNMSNTTSLMQNISAIGMIRKVFGWFTVSDLVIILPALVLFAIQYIKVKHYDNLIYQLGILVSALLFVVLFSTGSESCTYVIATTGVGIWLMLQKRPLSKYVIFLVSLVIFSFYTTSDLCPWVIRNDFVRFYALKSFPYLMVWFTMIYQLLTFKGSEDTALTSDYLIE